MTVPLLPLPLLLPWAAAPHPGPPVYLQLVVEERAVRLSMVGEQKVVNAWLGVEGVHTNPVDPAVRAALEAGARERLAGERLVTVDGAAARGTLEALEVFDYGPGNDEPTLQVDLSYALRAAPRTVTLEWPLFPAEGQGERQIPVVFKSELAFDFATLLPDEPRYTWHGRDLAAPSSVALRGPLEPGERRRLSLASVSVAGAALAALLAVRRAVLRVAFAMAGVGGALLLADVGRSVALGAVRLPTAAEAPLLFERLHRSIYDAFAARSEDALYATLAAAVELDVLDDLYGQIYESLVLRETGAGAFCTIESVTPLGYRLDLDPDADEPYFELEWSWRVEGIVTHFAHQHRRTNLQRARYGVVHDGQGWKIASMDLLEHRRMDDGQEFVTLLGEPAGDPAAEGLVPLGSTDVDDGAGEGDGGGDER